MAPIDLISTIIPQFSNLRRCGIVRTAPDGTLYVDMALSASDVEQDGAVVWCMLKSVDATFIVNSERPFLAQRQGRRVEILVAPDPRWFALYCGCCLTTPDEGSCR